MFLRSKATGCPHTSLFDRLNRNIAGADDAKVPGQRLHAALNGTLVPKLIHFAPSGECPCSRCAVWTNDDATLWGLAVFNIGVPSWVGRNANAMGATLSLAFAFVKVAGTSDGFQAYKTVRPAKGK